MLTARLIQPLLGGAMVRVFSLVRTCAGWVLILFGMAQCALTWRFWSSAEESAFWWFHGGVFMSVVGAINVLAAKESRLAIIVAALNGYFLIFYTAMLVELFYKFVRYPASFAGVAVLMVAVVSSSVVAARSVFKADRPRNVRS